MDIEGKVALLTGAAAGIGYGIANELLKNGAQGVLITDVNETTGQKAQEKLSEEYSSERISFKKVDVTNNKELEDAFKKAVELYGKLDIVVNNAGIINEQNYKLEVDINYTGVVNGVLLAQKYMGKDQLGKGGVVLNTSSVAAFVNEQCTPIYAGTKAAIIHLTRGLGHPLHFDRTGVKIMALCPGTTETGILVDLNHLRDGCMEEVMKIIAGQIIQTPDAVGRAAVYAIKNGNSASVWVIEENKLYKLNIPTWKEIGEPVISQI